MEKVRIGILGASGYTGAELLRLLCYHPQAEIRALTADRQAGKPIAAVFPHLAGEDLPDLTAIGEVDWTALDVVFCGLPHGTTQEVIAGLPRHLKIVDLSADFRLADTTTYAEWYGHQHRAPQGPSASGGLRPDRDRARKVRTARARRQSRLLSDLGTTAADPADASAADRCGRHHHRRQIRDQRRRPRDARGQPDTPRSPRAYTPTASPTTATHPKSSRASPRPPAVTSSSTSPRI